MSSSYFSSLCDKCASLFFPRNIPAVPELWLLTSPQVAVKLSQDPKSQRRCCPAAPPRRYRPQGCVRSDKKLFD
eukprot:754821-Hanusia_phi.AAC.2